MRETAIIYRSLDGKFYVTEEEAEKADTAFKRSKVCREAEEFVQSLVVGHWELDYITPMGTATDNTTVRHRKITLIKLKTQAQANKLVRLGKAAGFHKRMCYKGCWIPYGSLPRRVGQLAGIEERYIEPDMLLDIIYDYYCYLEKQANEAKERMKWALPMALKSTKNIHKPIKEEAHQLE